VALFNEDRDDTSITIRHDALQVVYFEKASELIYYEHGKWMRAATSD
jgi:hypothetical protein